MATDVNATNTHRILVSKTSVNLTTSNRSLSGSGNSSEREYDRSNRSAPSVGRVRCHRGDSDTAAQNVGAPDRDFQTQSEAKTLIVGGILLVVVVVALFFCRRNHPRKSRHEPSLTPFVRLQPPLDPSIAQSSRRRGSTTTEPFTRLSLTGRPPSKSLLVSTIDSVRKTGVWIDPSLAARRIPLDDVVLDQLISRSSVSEVHRGQYLTQRVAVKRIVPDRRKDLVYIEAFVHEVQFMSKLTHLHILRFIGVAWESLSELSMVSELMEGGDLRSYLTRLEKVAHRAHGFDAEKTSIAVGIVQGLAYLHALQPCILHRDLRSRHVMLDSQGTAKVGGFGIARAVINPTRPIGTNSLLWMAPEVLAGGEYTDKSDVYSFGVVLSEIDTHAAPYAHIWDHAHDGSRLSDAVILHMVRLGEARLAFTPSVSPASHAMNELAVACLEEEPLLRPSVPEILRRLHGICRAMID